MPICNIDKFQNDIPRGARLMGLDVGKKTIGLATSDGTRLLASAHSILNRRKFSEDMAKLFALIDGEEKLWGLVIGWPLSMEGRAGSRCDSVRDFAHALLKIRDMPILFQDERLSTAVVERMMIDADLTRQKREKRRDALAAAWILQSALDLMAAKDI